MSVNTFHNHTEGLDSAGTVQMLVDHVVELGGTYCGVCDHGTFLSAYGLNKIARSVGLKAVHGVELYIVNKWIEKDGKLVNKFLHLTVLAKNWEGFKTIVNIMNHPTSFIRRKRLGVMWDTLCAMSNHNIIVLSGCVSSPFQMLPIKQCSKLLSELKCDVYAEIMVHDGTSHAQRALRLSALGLKLVATNDSHFIRSDDLNLHYIRMKGKGWEFSKPIARHLYVKTDEELLSNASIHLKGDDFKKFEDAVGRTNELAASFDDYELATDLALPDTGVEDAEEYLRSFIPDNLTKEQNDRAEYEIMTIKTMGFMDYFVLCDQIASLLRDNGILVTIRGSAAGSYLLYLMGINPVDPIFYDIPFFRFLNLERFDNPDIDFDVSERDRAIELIKQKWPYSVQIMTVITFKEDSIKRILTKHNISTPHNIDRLIGTPQTWGKHAGGVILADAPIINIPRHGDRIAVSMHGFTNGPKAAQKFDVLGIDVLNILARMGGFPTDEEIRVNGKIGKETLSYHRAFVEPWVRKSAGIWQMGTPGAMQLAKQMHPSNLPSLALISALNRPSALSAGLHEVYTKVQLGLEESPYPTMVKDFLGDDIVPVFQEHIMGIVSYYVEFNEGYSPAKAFAVANNVRKILSKAPYRISDKAEYVQRKWEKIYKLFYNGCKIAGISDDEIELVLEVIVAMSRYGFGKGHAYSYAKLSAQTAYMKTIRKLDFLTEFMNITNDAAKHKQALSEIKRYGFVMSPPSINHSNDEFVNDGKKTVLPPIWFLKGFGRKTTEVITANKPYESFEDGQNRLGKKYFGKRLWDVLESGKLLFN